MAMEDRGSSDSTWGVERRSIEHIPPSERGGSPASLFTVWFGANMQVTTVVTGALGVILGLPLPWAILALVLGNLIGAVFMALHSAQGPKLGIPQMIQSRAQFGFHGAIVPLVLVLLMYVGFYASSAVLGGAALAGWWGISTTLGAILVSAVCTVLAIFGYWIIHRVERWVSVLAAVAFAYLAIRLFNTQDVGAAWSAGGSVKLGTFLLVVAIAATWQITYAPYVADYSRYLPESTPVRSTFWFTYSGSVIATVWMMALGSVCAAVASHSFEAGSSSFLVGLAHGGLRWAISLVIVLGIIAANVLNLYGMFMSSTTTITALRSFQMNTRIKALFIVCASAVGTAIGVAATANFLTNLENFILFLAYVLVPWTAINLADFYVVRKERYDMRSIFSPRGIYGTVNWRTMCAYVVAIAVEIPFMSTSFYTGPVVSHLGGADIAWVLGIVVAAVLYVILMRPVVAREEANVPGAGTGRGGIPVMAPEEDIPA